MTAAEFTAASIALLRSAVGWQSAVARRLGVASRTVRRWLADGATPPWVDARFAQWLGAADAAPRPRDEWLIGDAGGGEGARRDYIVHLRPPRFIARIIACDGDGRPEADELPADVVSGAVYRSDGRALAEIAWIDQVAPGETAQWLAAAAAALDAGGKSAAANAISLDNGAPLS